MAQQPSIVHVIIISILFVKQGITLLMYFDVHEEVLDIEVLDTELVRVASDHLPLIVELRFPAGAQ
jgi:hypothetical protein